MCSRPDMVAKTIAAWKVNQEVQVVHHEVYAIRRWFTRATGDVFRVQGLRSASWFAHALTFVARLCGLQAGENLFPCQIIRGHLLLPLCQISLLGVVTTWDPNGLPAAYPIGHGNYKGKGAPSVTRSKKVETVISRNYAGVGNRSAHVPEKNAPRTRKMCDDVTVSR